MAKSRDAFRTISEVADWLDTPAHVLRFWESKFTQVKPIKRAGGRRYYRPADMELLGGIKRLLHDDGMTIKGVQKILREQGVRHVASLSAQTVEDEAETGDGLLIQDAPFVDVEPDATATEPVDFAAAVRARGGAEQADPDALPEAGPDPDMSDAIAAEAPADHTGLPVAQAPVTETQDPAPEPAEAADAPAPDRPQAHPAPGDPEPDGAAEADDGLPARDDADMTETEFVTADTSMPDAAETVTEWAEPAGATATQSEESFPAYPDPTPESDLVEAGAEDWLPEQDDEDAGFADIEASEYAALAHAEQDDGTGPAQDPKPATVETIAEDDADPATLPDPETGPLTWLSAARGIDAGRAADIAGQMAALSALHERLSAPLRR